MPIITSHDNSFAAGTINPSFRDRVGSMFSSNDQLGNARQRMRQGIQTGGRYIDQGRGWVGRQANRAKSYLEAGPINDYRLNRVLGKDPKFGWGPADRRMAARLAGKRSLFSRVFSGPGHDLGKEWAKWSVGMGSSGVAGSGFEKSGKLAGRGLLGRAFGVGFTAYAAIEGYQKEGVWGAAKGAGTAVAAQYLMGRLLGRFGAPAAGIALTYGGLSLLGRMSKDPGSFSMRGMMRERTSAYREKYKGVQMGGTPEVDPFGINATMRQRAVQAIQNSRLNARSSLGNEAFLLSTPYFR